MKKILSLIKRFDRPIVFLTCLAILVVSIGISKHSYDIDEAFSIYVSHDLALLRKTLWNEEANMWLYYGLLHLWLALGKNEWIVRSMSAFFAIVSVPVLYHLASYLFNKKVAALAALFMVLNVFFVFYAQEARSYSLFLLLSIVSSYSFVRLGERKLFSIIYVVSSVLCLYAHYYAFFVLLAHFVSALIEKKGRGYFLAGFMVAVFSLPLFVSPSIHSSQVNWIARPEALSLVGTDFVLSGDHPVLFVVYGIIFLFSLKFLVNSVGTERYRFIMLWLAIPVVSAFLFSIFLKPIYQSVYFIACLPPFLILSAALVYELKNRVLAKVIIASIIVFSIVRLFYWYSGASNYKWVFSNASEDWRNAVSFASSDSHDGDVAIFYGYNGRLPYALYATATSPEVIEIASSEYPMGGGDIPDPDLALISSFNHPRVWFFVREANLGLPGRSRQLNETLNALNQKYEQKGLFRFAEIEVFLFEK